MALKLINALPSPFGRKIEIALKEKGIPYTVEYDMPWNDTTRTPDFNPLEQLPLVILEDGRSVYDSHYILDWLEREYPVPSLLPPDLEGVHRAKLLQLLGERLMEVALSLVLEMNRPDPSQKWLDRQSRKFAAGMRELDRLTAGSPPTADAPISMGDIAVVTTLDAIDFMLEEDIVTGFPLFEWRRSYPNLVTLADTLAQRPAFRETYPKMVEMDLKGIFV